MNKPDSPDSDAFRADEEKAANRAKTRKDAIRAGTALSARETVGRYGSANAEYIKSYTGIDNETGQEFARGLRDIGKWTINPEYADQNIKQQAGYAAEVAATSRDNAEAIIQKSPVRTARSDDLSQYGKNHPVVDRVQILDGQIIEGSQIQMKFVGNPNQLCDRIARKGGKFARYQGVKLELPSEQVDGVRIYCRGKAQTLREQAQKVEQHGKSDVAAKLRREADNYDRLASNVSDSGLTRKQATFYREHPGRATTWDIAHTSHRAGMEGAKSGAIIGGAISVLQNGYALIQGNKNASEAARDLTLDTGKTAIFGYATAAMGSAAKGVMQQASNQTLRTLADTSLPTLAVSVCVSLSGSIKRYVTGEISEAALLTEIGEKGAGMLASGMMAALGQIAIPIPVVGAAIGGMIGYTLSSFFYQSALDAARGAELSRQQLQRIRSIEAAARERIASEQKALDAFIQREIPQLQQETQALFHAVANTAGTGHADALAAAINQYATLLGRQLPFDTGAEFDTFMASDQPLKL